MSPFFSYKVLTVSKAIVELRDILGEDAISTDDDDLQRHGYSEWSSINIEQLPVAVAYPKSTEEVSDLAKVCYKYKIPMSKLVYSGGEHILNLCSPLFRRLES
jgi:D-lactate dehydrogenase (cytochrome)